MILSGSNDGSMMVILNRGDSLVATLTQVMSEHNVKGGLISGIGAIKDVELGYYELENQTYVRRKFLNEDFELLSLSGNISIKENVPYVHLHTVLGKKDFSTFGGHLFEAVVAVTAEITVIPLGLMPRRELDSAVGLALICGF